MSSFRCPICDSRFDEKRSLDMHVMRTKKHRNAIEEIWHLRFLFAEAERDKETYRHQRDEWRRLAVHLRDTKGGVT